MPRFHVVLKRVVNVIVDNVVAEDEHDALKKAQESFNFESLNNLRIGGATIDDGDDFTAAMVDELDENSDYCVESYFEFENGEFVEKDN